MTNREFYTAISKVEGLDKELVQFALEGIEKLDHKNSLRKTKPSKTALENAPLLDAIVEYLAEKETPILSTEIASMLEVSTSKATGLLGNLYKAERVNKVKVKVKGKGEQTAWSLIKPAE